MSHKKNRWDILYTQQAIHESGIRDTYQPGSVADFLKAKEKMPDIKFEIIKKIGVLSVTSKGWTKELNLVSWNDRPAKYDIREWSPDRETMSKGITLSEEELAALRELLNGADLT